jgi:N-acetyl-anhydromuramyl-L-alanine amidase AmpD
MLFIQAKNCGPARPGVTVNLVVVHTMEAPEKPHTARGVAQWFASAVAPQASAHYCIDSDETIQCVKEDVVAWAAPGANRDGIHLEHAGYARQSAVDWSDLYSTRMLERSAALAAELVTRHNIPIVRLDGESLRTPGVRGFCGHVDVTNGRNGGHGHTDPGVSFPWDRYLALVQTMLRPTDAPTGAEPDDIA